MSTRHVAYYKTYFPAPDVYKNYRPPILFTKNSPVDDFLARFQPSTAIPTSWRIFTVGPISHRNFFHSADELRAELVKNANATPEQNEGMFRYDVGPALNVEPAQFRLHESSALFVDESKARVRDEYISFNDFKIDIDATDLTTVRSVCECDKKEKTAMCIKCCRAVVAVARFIEIKLATLRLPFGDCRPDVISHWRSTGGRGVHGILDSAIAARLNSAGRMRITEALCDPINVPPEAKAELQRAESQYGYSIVPKIDQKVTMEAGHNLRGIYSIHDDSRNICVVLKHLEDFSPTSSPSLEDVINSHGRIDSWQQSLYNLKELNRRTGS